MVRRESVVRNVVRRERGWRDPGRGRTSIEFLARVLMCVGLIGSAGCEATFRLETRTPVVANLPAPPVRDVQLWTDARSDERIFQNLSADGASSWKLQIERGLRDTGLFRRIDIRDRRVDPGEATGSWYAEVVVSRTRRDPGGLDSLFLLSGFIIPTYTQTDLTLTLILTDPEGTPGPAVVRKAGMRAYVSWLMIPVGIFGYDSGDLERDLIYELTLDALTEARNREIL